MGTGRKPLIGITTPDNYHRTSLRLIRLAVRLEGGIPLQLTPSHPQYEHEIDGLILAGGTDVHPSHYKTLPKENYPYDHPRDALEFRWIRQAEERCIPVLGICRGAQLMNVHRGGDLHMDISKVYEKANYPNGTIARIFYRKGMHIRKDTLLHSLVGEEWSRVNSMHTQSINQLGAGLKISGEERNTIVQCVEDPRFPMFLGVQFHPEYLIYAKRYRRIFHHLIAIAREREQGKKQA